MPNLGAAIQRIPGVSVNRGLAGGMGGLPTTTGDATQITVRGFGPTFNESLYDGRISATSTGDRGFDFSAVGSNFVQEVDILKTPDATLSAGAIGATINVKFPKPFDSPGLKIAASGSASYSPHDGQATPNGGVLFSDTFANDTLGVLAFVDYSKSALQNNHINVQGWPGAATGTAGNKSIFAVRGGQRRRPARRTGSSRTTASTRNTSPTSARMPAWCSSGSRPTAWW